MLGLHLPWLELAIMTPLVGAIIIWPMRDPEQARRIALIAAGLTLFWCVGAWEDFNTLHAFAAHDRWDWASALLGPDGIVIDELSAPLLPLAALLFFVMILSTLRTKVRRFPFRLTLVSCAIVIAMLCTKQPWLLILLAIGQAIAPWLELRERRRPLRPFVVHMLLFAVLLIAGWGLVSAAPTHSAQAWWGALLLMGAVMVRNGVIPFHCWVTDLFENATLGTALLFVTPMTGAYVFMRLALPVASDQLLQWIALASLATSVYAAGMALVQREARRFFVYLFLSHSSLVLVGLESASPLGLTGGLCVWLSVGLSLAGFGITLRAIESRAGRISLADYHGLYEHMPTLAVFFLLTGLASVGFPGTAGFVGSELLVEGAVQQFPTVGILVILAAALNGIAVLHAFFRLFTGTQHTSSVSLSARWQERAAILALSLLILGGGLIPQPGVRSRFHAASELLSRRSIAGVASTAEHARRPDRPLEHSPP